MSQAEPRSFFLGRLLPPRPEFAGTLTADERRVMEAHIACWQEQMRLCKMLLFGPVADPSGEWGLGIPADRKEAEELTAADPAICSGRGFRYELLPMPRVVRPG